MALRKTRAELDAEMGVGEGTGPGEDATADEPLPTAPTEEQTQDELTAVNTTQVGEGDEERPFTGLIEACTEPATPDGPAERPAQPEFLPKMKMVLESLLFAWSEPVGPAMMLEVIREIQPDLSARGLREVLEGLREELRRQARGIRLVEVGNGFQLRTPTESGPYLRKLIKRRPPRMTKPTLETLAIIAYRQPITRPEIEDIRGVDSGQVVRHLLDKKLVRILGRREESGRPLIYATTKEFLGLFALKDLKSLPTLKDFVELSDEHRASLGLEPAAQAGAAGEVAAEPPPGPDLLEVEDTNAYAPVGNDEVIQELAAVLDEVRVRNRRVREVFQPEDDAEASEGDAQADPAEGDEPEAVDEPTLGEDHGSGQASDDSAEEL